MSDRCPISILVVDDDPDDQLLIGDAFKQTQLAANLSFVEDGKALLDYLRHRGRFAEPRPPRPVWYCLTSTCPVRMGGKRWPT